MSSDAVTSDGSSDQSSDEPEKTNDEEEYGVIKPDGSINWNCPCLGGMADGPCGEAFREAFSCFHYSEAEPKGSDCMDRFRAMQDCFIKYPEVYGKYTENDDEENDEDDDDDDDDDEDDEDLDDIVDIGGTGDIVDIGGTGDIVDIGGTGDIVDIGGTDDIVDIGGTDDIVDIGGTGDIVDIGGTGDVNRCVADSTVNEKD